MKNKTNKRRSDRPSGRQAMDLPEHSGKSPEPAVSSLHQGQGPDFPTQEDDVRPMNDGIRQLYDDVGPHQQRITPQEPSEEDVPEQKRDQTD